MSENDIPLSVDEALGFVILKVSVDSVLIKIPDGENDLPNIGGSTTTREDVAYFVEVVDVPSAV